MNKGSVKAEKTFEQRLHDSYERRLSSIETKLDQLSTATELNKQREEQTRSVLKNILHYGLSGFGILIAGGALVMAIISLVQTD